jgi:hypothetical protein
MEARRKGAVEKRKRKCNNYKDHIWNYFVSDDPGTEITPEILKRICYHFINEKRNRGKWTKLKSFRRFLTKHGFIKWDFERDIYFNCYKIKRLEENRAETDRRKAEDEQRRVEREAQQAEAKPPQAHRETQSQQGTQAEPSELERLKGLRVQRLRFLDSIRKQVLDHPEQSHAWEPIIEKGKLFIADLEIKISELENCEAKL